MLRGLLDKGRAVIIQSDDNENDKITIHHLFNDKGIIERVFWFDISECFGY
jgi:hypothetical protein